MRPGLDHIRKGATAETAYLLSIIDKQEQLLTDLVEALEDNYSYDEHDWLRVENALDPIRAWLAEKCFSVQGNNEH